MEKTAICPVCGRAIDAAFPFCPWCRSPMHHDMRRDGAAEAAGFIQAFPGADGGIPDETAENRIERLCFSLGQIERDLDVFLEGTRGFA